MLSELFVIFGMVATKEDDLSNHKARPLIAMIGPPKIAALMLQTLLSVSAENTRKVKIIPGNVSIVA